LVGTPHRDAARRKPPGAIARTGIPSVADTLQHGTNRAARARVEGTSGWERAAREGSHVRTAPVTSLGSLVFWRPVLINLPR
jgi:hypothetical protein